MLNKYLFLHFPIFYHKKLKYDDNLTRLDLIFDFLQINLLDLIDIPFDAVFVNGLLSISIKL